MLPLSNRAADHRDFHVLVELELVLRAVCVREQYQGLHGDGRVGVF